MKTPIEGYQPNINLTTTPPRKVTKDMDEYKLREQMLLQFGDFMWHCSDDEDGDRDLAIGFDDKGMPNSVSLEIFGRTHSEFTFKI